MDVLPPATDESRPGLPTVSFRTFGCKANQYDTERMRQEVEARGMRVSRDWSGADVCVVNTCTVTNQADADARRFVRRLRRENPGVRVVVAGCSAVLRGDAYRAMAEVSAVVEGHDPVEVAGAVHGEPALVQLGVRTSLDRLDIEPVAGAILTRRAGATRGWIKIQDGCDRRCAFCATRLARGPSRSRSPDEVVSEARALARHHPELVITGIHIGHYGRDLAPSTSLSALVARLLDDVGVRLRLGSVEATEIDDRLLRLLESGEGRLARHLHMPLQSGADPVLRRMRRWHTREAYRRRALEIAERVPGIGLGADVITGFPGETQADHEATRALVSELPFTYLHVFPYSPRDGTAAAGLPDPVPERIATQRARDLRDLALEKGRKHRVSRLGEVAEVALEAGGRRGVTGDYLRVSTRPAGGRDSRVLHRGTLTGSPDDLRIDLPPAGHRA